MFGKRRRTTSNPASRAPAPAPPSASASLAATKAFVRDRQSNGSLSSSAAAAALRTHTTSPTPVGDTVTKRMIRKGSTSSHGSGSPQLGLRRHSSSGSMTERSFRAPSPNRGSPVVGHAHDAPPVPPVPKNVPSDSVVHRRASSLEPHYRGGSPAGRGSGRGVSLDRGAEAMPSRQRVTSLSQVPENEHQSNSPAPNFSRPISPPLSSPARPARGGHSGYFAGPVVNMEQGFRGAPASRPKTSDGASQYDLHSAQQAVHNAAARPVSSHRTHFSHGVEGARLAAGSMKAKPSGSSVAPRPRAPSGPVDPNSPNAVYDPSTRKFIHKQDAMARFRALHEDEAPAQQYIPPVRSQSPPHHRASQPSPTPFRDVRQRSLSPPPQRVERPFEHEPEPEHQPPLQAQPTHHPAEYEERPSTPLQVQPGALLARRPSEDFAEADIRPPTDANISRKLESSVPEPAKEVHETPISPKLAGIQDSAYPRLPAPIIGTPTNTLAGRGKGSVRTDRNHSLSPPRTAHFATGVVEVLDGIKHQPPARSVSPAKSALKLSHSDSRRNSSPMAVNGRMLSKGAPSEASDTMSEDGFKKKKKVVRVSFEEEPIIAGTSAYGDTETPSSPTGLSQSRWSTSNQEQDLDDLMKPRPVLPSFGSVRDKNRRNNEEDVPEKVTETVSSSMSTSVGSIGEPLEASSDHALAGIVSQDFASKKQVAPLEPLPPEVTSVEGTGYVSDSDQSDMMQYEASTQEPERTVQSEPALPEPKSLTNTVESKPQIVDVPDIAIQPATPGLAEAPEPKLQLPVVPGGWGTDEESDQEERGGLLMSKLVTETPTAPYTPAPAPQAQDSESSDDNDSIYSDAYEELTDEEGGGFASIDALVGSPVSPSSSGLMHSIYANTSTTEPTQSGLRNEYVTPAKTDVISAPTNNWEATRQHWSGLIDSKQQEQQDVSVSNPEDRTTIPELKKATTREGTARVIPSVAPEQSKVGQKERREEDKVVAKAPKIAQVSQSSQRTQPPAQPRKSALKKTTPVAQPVSTSEPRMKKTMRGNTGPQAPAPSDTHTHMRKSMRSSEPLGTSRMSSGLATSRHSMSPAGTNPPKGALQKKNLPTAIAAASAPKPRPLSAAPAITTRPMATAPTYDSDSDASASSFQRERRARAPRGRGGGGRYTMRGSMRTDAVPTMRNTPAMRPVSPPTTTASPPPSSFRKSLRPSSPTPEASGVKSSRFSIRSLSPAGRFRLSKGPAQDAPPLPTHTSSPKRTANKAPAFGKPAKSKAPSTGPSKSGFRSRFADSSDEEDEARPSRFQSRFADSDDDDDFELPPGLAPVRGIPKRAGDDDGDSTDLEEELSDDEPASAKAAPKNIEKSNGPITNVNSTGEGAAFTAGSLRTSKHAPELPTFEAGKKSKAKRGFFGLGKKKTPDAVGTENGIQAAATIDIPMPPAHRERDPNRPLTPIGEDDKVLEASPGPRSPKLQRRSTPQWGRSASDSWPLPEPPKIGEEARPQSSDGIAVRRTSLRPTLTKRFSSQISESARTAIDPKSGKEVIVGRTGKKKKFSGLRRVFGLND